jgi:hypothetical protein
VDHERIMSLNYEGSGIYRHYKGGEYEVLGLAVREETLSKLGEGIGGVVCDPEFDYRVVQKTPEGVTVVVYRPLTPGSLLEKRDETMWTRELSDFNERVDDGTVPRFERISDRDLEFVGLDHLECMGINMALQRESDKDGLSEPQQSAFDKIQRAFSILFAKLNLGG